MVRIVNWLLTRKCNLRCEYCGIVKVNAKYFRKTEMSTDRVTSLLDKFNSYNPNIFHIFYGGEPFLREDIGTILGHCNDNDIQYTVISNCTPDIQPKILKAMKESGGFRGLTASIDPSILMEPSNSHSQMKSSAGFYFLMKMRNYGIDTVAEVTMTKQTLEHTYDLIKMLSGAGIYTSLTAIDINKNLAYDFSAYSDTKHLIKDNLKLEELYHKIMSDDSLLIHMKDELLPILFRNISSTYDCELENSVHNLTIDADGTIRTCLRMRGFETPQLMNDENILVDEYDSYVLNGSTGILIGRDREAYCKGCNHTCVMMSKLINDNRINKNKIIDH